MNIWTIKNILNLEITVIKQENIESIEVLRMAYVT